MTEDRLKEIVPDIDMNIYVDSESEDTLDVKVSKQTDDLRNSITGFIKIMDECCFPEDTKIYFIAKNLIEQITGLPHSEIETKGDK
jgi:hypothetical protein